MNLGQYSTSAAQPGISVENIGRLKLPFPPLEEQETIARFLDYKTRQIDALIAKKEALLEKLEEKRSALISHAVTKGLDRSVPMKDSGVEWLGEIPEHWNCVAFRWCCYIVEGQVDPKEEKYKHLTLVAPNHIESKTGKLLVKESVEEQGAISGKYLYEPGYLLYSKIRPELVKACVSDHKGLCSADMYPIQTGETLNSQYMLYQLISDGFTRFAILVSDRVAMPKVNREKLGGFKILIPSLEEQKIIVSFLDKKIAEIDQQKARIEKAIALLKEYRTTLITNAVTGKIDVRSVPLPTQKP